MAYALERGKPVLCLARTGVPVSKMLSGIRQAGYDFQTYASEAEAQVHLEAFLAP